MVEYVIPIDASKEGRKGKKDIRIEFTIEDGIITIKRYITCC